MNRLLEFRFWVNINNNQRRPSTVIRIHLQFTWPLDWNGIDTTSSLLLELIHDSISPILSRNTNESQIALSYRSKRKLNSYRTISRERLIESDQRTITKSQKKAETYHQKTKNCL